MTLPTPNVNEGVFTRQVRKHDCGKGSEEGCLRTMHKKTRAHGRRWESYVECRRAAPMRRLGPVNSWRPKQQFPAPKTLKSELFLRKPRVVIPRKPRRTSQGYLPCCGLIRRQQLLRQLLRQKQLVWSRCCAVLRTKREERSKHWHRSNPLLPQMGPTHRSPVVWRYRKKRTCRHAGF